MSNRPPRHPASTLDTTTLALAFPLHELGGVQHDHWWNQHGRMTESMRAIWNTWLELSDQKRPLSEPDVLAERPRLAEHYHLN
jgi:hypothetical protein